MQNELQQITKEVFTSFCNYLDEIEWKYDINEDEGIYQIFVSSKGEDLQINLSVNFLVNNQIVTIYSKLPFIVSEEKRVEMALAIHMINNAILDGTFCYDINEGEIYFKMTSCFRGGLISKETFNYLLFLSCSVIDDYNDKLLAIDRGFLDLAGLLKKISE